MIECVVFMVLRDKHLLIERRRHDKRLDPSIYAIPGGHCQPTESVIDTLEREMLEELGITAKKTHYICTLLHKPRPYLNISDDEKSKKEVPLLPKEVIRTDIQKVHYYAVPQWQGDLLNNEAEQLLWINLEDSHRLDLPVDRTAVQEYLRILNY